MRLTSVSYNEKKKTNPLIPFNWHIKEREKPNTVKPLLSEHCWDQPKSFTLVGWSFWRGLMQPWKTSGFSSKLFLFNSSIVLFYLNFIYLFLSHRDNAFDVPRSALVPTDIILCLGSNSFSLPNWDHNEMTY